VNDAVVRPGPVGVAHRPLAPVGLALTQAQPGRERDAALARSVAVIVAFLAGLDLVIHAGVAIGDVVAVLLLPVWLPVLRKYAGARYIVGVGVIGVVWGYFLTVNAASSGFVINGSGRLQSAAHLLGAVGSIGLLLWGRTVVSFARLGAAFGLGMIVHAGISHIDPSGNAWKFIWAVPVGVFLLSLASMSGRPAISIVVLLGLAGVSSAEACRSYSAALVLAAILVLWSGRPRAPQSPTNAWIVNVGFLAALAVGIYRLASSLLVDGYLGAAAQARTIAELHASGSLLLGGRPEISATWALFTHRPSGYGLGVVAGPHDIAVAKAGMANIGYNPNNGYVERFMFGDHIELHSVIGDMWAYYGWAGILFAVSVGLVVIRYAARSISHRTGDALALFLCVWMGWNLAFSPLTAAFPVLILAVAGVADLKAARTGHQDG
jgi:hypothetical protein